MILTTQYPHWNVTRLGKLHLYTVCHAICQMPSLQFLPFKADSSTSLGDGGDDVENASGAELYTVCCLAAIEPCRYWLMRKQRSGRYGTDTGPARAIPMHCSLLSTVLPYQALLPFTYRTTYR